MSNTQSLPQCNQTALLLQLIYVNYFIKLYSFIKRCKVESYF